MPVTLGPPRASFHGTTGPIRAGEFGYRPSDATEGVKDDPTQEHRRAEGGEWVDPIEIDHDVPPGWVVQEAHRRHQQALDINVLPHVARRRLGAIDVADPVIDRRKADRR